MKEPTTTSSELLLCMTDCHVFWYLIHNIVQPKYQKCSTAFHILTACMILGQNYQSQQQKFAISNSSSSLICRPLHKYGNSKEVAGLDELLV
jgi:hypothetical protein